MSSSFWLLGVESCHFSHERSACKAEQIYKFSLKMVLSCCFCENRFVNLLSFASSSFFLSLRKITWLNSQQPKTRGHVKHLSCYKMEGLWQSNSNTKKLGENAKKAKDSFEIQSCICHKFRQKCWCIALYENQKRK